MGVFLIQVSTRFSAGDPRRVASILRILFLDDNPARAHAFLSDHPEAIWVRTAEQCLAKLAEPWDEVHLDHDLGGEAYVDHERDDCGMAVIRRLSEAPYPHLRTARFFVHTHNPNAACMMVHHLQVMGFDVRACPFGTSPLDRPRDQTLVQTLTRWLRSRWIR